jgi:phage protein D
MEFLQQRAHRIGYRLNVRDKTLHFQPVPETESGELTLSPDQNLLAFYPRLTTLPQVGQVSVRAWNPQEKAPIIGQANNGIVPMGGSTSGPSAADNAFGPSQTADVMHPVFTRAEADQVAQGHLKERALSYIQGEGQCIGSPDLRAGTVIDIANIGTRFSGPYFVTSATHTYTPSRGYRTAFTVRRNAT